jgi:hypothetical protein
VSANHLVPDAAELAQLTPLQQPLSHSKVPTSLDRCQSVRRPASAGRYLALPRVRHVAYGRRPRSQYLPRPGRSADQRRARAGDDRVAQKCAPKVITLAGVVTRMGCDVEKA